MEVNMKMKNFLFTILAIFSLSLLFATGNASATSPTEDDEIRKSTTANRLWYFHIMETNIL